MRYDMIHVTPPMSPPEFVRTSALANADGWVEVDKHSLQHVRYPEVFGLGDASNLPTSKTGAAIRKQAPVVVANLVALRAGQPLTARYDGYTSCPVVTGRGKLVMAEFNYAKEPVETFPVDQRAERFSMYALKAHMLPRLYWHGMLRGRA
jgi:sulfide:quinone oxidoreductase